ncbi:MAG: hypothetical protein ACLU0O_09870 [Collinsella sp.]
MSDAQFADEIMVPELHRRSHRGQCRVRRGLIDSLAAIVKPRTKMPATP